MTQHWEEMNPRHTVMTKFFNYFSYVTRIDGVRYTFFKYGNIREEKLYLWWVVKRVKRRHDFANRKWDTDVKITRKEAKGNLFLLCVLLKVLVIIFVAH